MSREKGRGIPSVTRSVRIPADLNEWASNNGINVNGTLIAALEARRGEHDIPKRIGELNERRADITSEINRLVALEDRKRARSADRVILRSCIDKLLNVGTAPIPEMLPLRALNDMLDRAAAAGQMLTTYRDGREIGNEARELWVEMRENALLQIARAREAAVLATIKEGAVRM